MLERQVQFWNIWLSYAFHFQSVPNMCLNDWWSHMVPWIKHFIVHRLRAFQQLYYRSLKIKMIQLLRGYVSQWTFSFSFFFFFFPSLFFALKCVTGLSSWPRSDTDHSSPWWWRTASYLQFAAFTPMSTLKCCTRDFARVYGMSGGGRAGSCCRLFPLHNWI